MPGKHSRNKGARFEREIVNYLREKGYEAERIPLSGAMGSFKGDIQVDLVGVKRTFECKTLANGFKFLYSKLADNSGLLLKADRQEVLIVLKFDKFLKMLDDSHDEGLEWGMDN